MVQETALNVLSLRAGRPTRFLAIKSEIGLPGGSVVRKSAANAGDTGLIPSLGRFHVPMGPLSPYA